MVNQHVPVFGGGYIWRGADGRIISEPRARSPDNDRDAWHLGLTKAIRRKLAKSKTYSQKVDVLLVYAEWLRINTIDEKTENVVLPAIQDAIRESSIPFTKLIILDHGAYVEYPHKSCRCFLKSAREHQTSLIPILGQLLPAQFPFDGALEPGPLELRGFETHRTGVGRSGIP